MSGELSQRETLDGLFRDLRFIQRRDGYRFSEDPVLLAAWTGTPKQRCLDLGTGCGVLAVLLARRGAAQVDAVEIQGGLAGLARRNVELNGMGDRVVVHHADLRSLPSSLHPDASYQLVASNPPYFPAGNVSPVEEKAIARHEISCTLRDVVRAGARLLCPGGELHLVLPVNREKDFWMTSTDCGLSPERMRLVRPSPAQEPTLLLATATKGKAGPLEVLPELVLHDEAGNHTPEGRRLFTDPCARLDS